MNRIEAEALMSRDGHPLDFLEALLRRPAWHADALCREHPEITWFPTRGEPLEPARAVCARCPVAQECADFADAHDETLHGIWGGMSTSERERRRVDSSAGLVSTGGRVVHGTRSAYEAAGCRCRACRSGHARRRRLAA